LILGLSGFLLCLGVLGAILIGLTVIAAVLIVPVWLKLTLLGIGVCSLVVLAGLAIIRHLWWGQVDDIALRLETRYPELKGRLIAAIQFVRMNRVPGYSSELVAETQTQAIRDAAKIDFSQAVSARPLMRPSRWLAVTVVVVVALLMFLPSWAKHSWNVYSSPLTEIAPPLGYRLIPSPGSTQWVKYRDLQVGAAMVGDQFPDEARAQYRPRWTFGPRRSAG